MYIYNNCIITILCAYILWEGMQASFLLHQLEGLTLVFTNLDLNIMLLFVRSVCSLAATRIKIISPFSNLVFKSFKTADQTYKE